MAGAEEILGGGVIRWIAILPLLAAMAHGLLIGLARARISDRTIVAISLSALAGSFTLSALSLFDLVGVAERLRILDPVAPWIGGGVGPRHFSAELTFQFDPLSAVFCLAITGIGLAVYAHAVGQLAAGLLDREQGHRTFALLDLLVGSTLVLVLADNLLLFFLGWAGVGVASQLFASFDFADRTASRAGATTFVIGRIGDLGLLAAMLLLFDGLSRAGAPALTFRGIEAAFRLLEGQGVLWLAYGFDEAPLLLEIVGFGLVLAALTKCAQVPLHFWLPHSTGGPIVANALMQSTTTVVVGIYVLLRFAFLLESAPGALRLLIAAGTTTLLLASVTAANQRSLPRMLALTTSAVLGIAVLGVGIGAASAATYLLLTHAFAKALLWLAAGVVIATQEGETDLRRMGGLAQRMRWTHGIFGLGALALVGVPPLADFFPMEEMLAFIWASARPESDLVLAIVLVSEGVLAYAVARAFFLIFWGTVRPGGVVARALFDPAGWRQHSLTVLAVLTFLAGLLTPSQFWAELFEAPTQQMDSVGHFLAGVIPGAPDPELDGFERGALVVAHLATLLLGLGVATIRHARRGYRGEPRLPAGQRVADALREGLYVEGLLLGIFVRPLRRLSQVALARGIETGLIDRVVVSGGSGLVRRTVWSLLRRLQNGRMQSYALLGLLTAVVLVTWMAV